MKNAAFIKASRASVLLALMLCAAGGAAYGQFAGTALITAFTSQSPRNNFTGDFGMMFTVGATPMNVTALGRLCLAGNHDRHTVRLVNASDGADVAGGSVTISTAACTTGEFVYGALASPVALASGASYFLLSGERLDGDLFYDLAGVTPAPAVAVNNGEVAWPGVGYYAIGGANSSFGPVNLLWLPASPPPAVSITAPTAGATVFGNVTVTADAAVSATAASAGLTLSNVQFQVDGANYGTPATSLPYSVVLDTTKLNNGTHTVAAVATDSGLNAATSAAVSITVNNQATSVTISSPIEGATVSGSQVAVAASAIPASGKTIASVQFEVDQANYGLPVTANPYSIVLDSTKLNDGPHSLIAVATDSGGGSAISPPIGIVVNNSVTTVVITAPAAPAEVSGANLTVTATATARTGLTIASVQFQVDGKNQGAPVTASPYTIAVDTTQLSNGPHTLVAVAADSLGATVNSSPVTITVNNLTGPPASPGTDFVTGFTGILTRNNFTGGFGMKITVGASPVNVTALGRMFVAGMLSGGNKGTHTLHLVTAATGVDLAGGTITVSMTGGTPGRFVYAALPSPVTLVANGVYYLLSDEVLGGDAFTDLGPVTSTSVATVNGGEIYWPGIGFYSVGTPNSSYGPVSFLYVAPVTPPTVSITAPAGGATISGAAVNITASASAAASLAISKVQFQVDNADYGAAATMAPYAVVIDSTKLANGTHTLKAVATDTSGASNTSAAVTLTVNNTPTAVSIVTPVNGAAVAGNKVAVVATATAAAGLTITGVQFQVDNLSYGQPVTASPYSMLVDATTLTDGTHSLTAVATDSSGKSVTSAVVSVTVNNSVTSVVITAPAAGATISGPSFVLTATATPRAGLTIDSVQFQVDGVDQGSAVTSSPYTVTVDATKLSNGPHTAVALARDSGGNTVSSAVITIAINNSAPPVLQGTPLVSGFSAGLPRNNFTGAVGMKFTTGTVPITVTALGRLYIDGNSQDHLVRLVSANGADVPTAAVVVSLPSGTAGQFVYAPLANPVTLAPNTAYYLLSSETEGGDQFYNFGPVTAAPVVNVNSAGLNWLGVGLFDIGPANNGFGPVSLLYTFLP